MATESIPPEEAIQGTKIGAICDRCNRGIQNGETVGFYATYYEDAGWTLRRLYCTDCGETTVDPPTEGADEVIGAAVWFNHVLAAVRIIDRSRPEEGSEQ
ncbi:hypothetical protein [Salinarchaeum laminariae]|uniref:hypothetical protein n=1 Tax=Salinarchaeum laminariae TaxID=869888 RepID=UPI0020BD7255|nr:hypothetical protein [Salinarchaeum laminariae]